MRAMSRKSYNKLSALAFGTTIILLAWLYLPTVFSKAASSCVPFIPEYGTKMAIIRIDDIQAYWLETESMKLIEDARARSVPVSLGVIPLNIDADTPIRKFLENELCWIEIAQHGFDHQGETPDTPEVGNLDYQSAFALISEGARLLSDLSGEPVVTFIPPLNEMSDAARKAANDLGFKVISSEGIDEFDYGATAYNYETDQLNSVDTVLMECARRLESSPHCVIMVHPQDYTTNDVLDEIKYMQYIALLDRLKAEGYTFVRFKDVVGR